LDLHRFHTQYFTTGAAYQFDWSYDGGVECVVKIAHPEKWERKNIEVWEEAHALQRSMPAPLCLRGMASAPEESLTAWSRKELAPTRWSAQL
jgi:hypothetical protein